MAKFKVVKPYKDKELGKTLNVKDEVEMTVKRADEVHATLKEKGYDLPFLERVEEKEKGD